MTLAATDRDTTIRHARPHAPTEEARWILALGAPFVVAAAFLTRTEDVAERPRRPGRL